MASSTSAGNNFSFLAFLRVSHLDLVNTNEINRDIYLAQNPAFSRKWFDLLFQFSLKYSLS